MDRLEILKKAKEKVDALVAEKNREVETESYDEEATKMAVEMQKHDALIDAIEKNYTSPEEIGRIFADAIAQIEVKVPEINVPELKIPEIKVPEAKVTVNIPEIKLPTINVPTPEVTVNVPDVIVPPIEVKMPESMEVHGEVGLFGYGFDNPLPVQLRDAEGNPLSFPDLVSIASGGGGPRFVKINNTVSEPIPISGNITSTPGATYYASDAIGSVNIVQSIPLNVSVSGASGTIGVVTINPDGNPVYGGAGSASSVSVTDIFGTTGVNVINPDGRLKVELPTGSSGLTDTELRASSIDVQQASGASWSTSVLSLPNVTVTSITNSVATSILGGDGQTLDPRNRTWTITETVPISSSNTLDVQQVSGASWSTNVLSMPAVVVTSVTNSTAITLLNGEGVARDTWGASQVGTWNITTLTGVTNTLAVANIDSSGVQYSGSNPFPVAGTVVVSSVTASTASALVDSTGVQYSGSNPVPTKEIKPTTGTNTSVADNAASTTILVSNTARIGATVYNDSSATLYLLLGSTAASTTNYTCKVVSSGYYEVPFGYTGQLTGIWASDPGDGAARVTEIT